MDSGGSDATDFGGKRGGKSDHLKSSAHQDKKKSLAVALRGHEALYISRSHEKEDLLLGRSDSKDEDEDKSPTLDERTLTEEERRFSIQESVLFQACKIAWKLYYYLHLESSEEGSAVEKYLTTLFQKIPKELFKQLQERQKSEASSDLILSCKVVKASNLPAKDANGLSDPYCVLGILPQRHFDSKQVRNHNLEDWKKEGFVQEVEKSSVVEKNLNPEWNETFELKVLQPDQDYLVVEVWDNDADMEVRTPTGVGKLGRFFQDLGIRKNDFIGRAFFSVKLIPVGGGEKVLQLRSHSSKSHHGDLTVLLTILGKYNFTPEELQQGMQDHRRLLEVMAVTESTHFVPEESASAEKVYWKGEFRPIASKILSSHTSVMKLSKLQEASLRFLVFFEYYKFNILHISTLRVVVKEIRENDHELKSLAPGRDNPVWVDNLLKGLKNLWFEINGLLKNHLTVALFEIKTAAGLDQLEQHLQTLHELYSIQAFVQQLSEKERDYKTVVQHAIEIAVPTWYLLLMPTQSNTELHVFALKGKCNHAYKHSTRALNDLHPIFMKTGVDYFSPFFTSLDQLLNADASTHLSTSDDNMILLVYEVYQTVKKLYLLADKVDPSYLKGLNRRLSIVTYHQWFKGFVTEWLRIAMNKAKKKIYNAIAVDQIVEVTESAQYSSSAVDADYVFAQIVSFWKDLSWPDREQSYGHFGAIIKGLCELAVYYAEVVHTKLKSQDITDSFGRFHISDKLCVTLNNTEHVKQILLNVEEEVDFKSFQEWLSQPDPNKPPPDPNQPKLGELAKNLMDNVISSAEEDMRNKIGIEVENIIKRLSPEIAKFVPKIMEDDSDPDTAVNPLLDYIEENLVKLNQSLLNQVFIVILAELWKNLLAVLLRECRKIEHRQSTRHLHQRLWRMLQLASDFFHADGGGLSGEHLENEQFKVLASELRMARMSTEEVIRVFLSELVQQQANAATKNGTLHFSHLYSSSEEKVKVDVVSANGIRGLDRSGKSDPYVELYLLPETSFHKMKFLKEKQRRTSTKKQTLDPLYNETLTLPAASKDMQEKGSVLLLAMFDQDKIGKDDFAGMCVVSCDEIPDGEERKMEHLPLFEYTETPAMVELVDRIKDDAADFCKLMKEFLFDPDTGPKLLKKRSTKKLVHEEASN